MLTPAQRKRLAKEARKLAMECVEERAPNLYDWPNCAVAVAASRAGVMPADLFFGSISHEARPEMWLVANGNDWGISQAEKHAWVVFPLLALADALEEA